MNPDLLEVLFTSPLSRCQLSAFVSAVKPLSRIVGHRLSATDTEQPFLLSIGLRRIDWLRLSRPIQYTGILRSFPSAILDTAAIILALDHDQIQMIQFPPSHRGHHPSAAGAGARERVPNG